MDSLAPATTSDTTRAIKATRYSEDDGGTPTFLDKVSGKEERPGSSMQCSQMSLSTCPTARTSPVHRFLPFPTPEGCAVTAVEERPLGEWADGTRVEFDVGGWKSWCTVGTLRGSGGFFGALLRRPWSGEAVAIDRNGAVFSYVLDWLRRGSLSSADDCGLLDQIAFEADFYMLPELREAALNRLQEIERRANALYETTTRLNNVLVLLERRHLMAASRASSTSHGSEPIAAISASWDDRALDGQSPTSSHCSLYRRHQHHHHPPPHLNLSRLRSPNNQSPTCRDSSSHLDDSFEADRAALINDDPEEPAQGASPQVLCSFYSQDCKFATDEDF
eukprot:Protomagalhaensia_sp_Gyna_25__5041@NODE_563_length_3119_cov_131_509416_g438_i0_p2_GENE_NODE_563_length_3119_cov_131_509416_g438_i0NODE_563_length_3119_cov_131_509416_g438_i0_p2_ORF_typecomplete_len334_score57_33BTB_2/PF02214_22/7_7e10_NODE_563_length_3119_cov_131_509416_g438_i0841085